MKYQASLILCFLVLSSACSKAPLSVRTFSTSSSDNKQSIEMEYLFREGKYCAMILLGSNDANKEVNPFIKDNKPIKNLLNGNVNVKYNIKIPQINYDKSIDLGVFDNEGYGYLYEGGYFYHQFTVNINSPSSPRAKAYVSAVINGERKVLDNVRFGMQISEWACK